MRARRSSAEMGFASAVMDFNSAADAAGSQASAVTAMSEAPAAPWSTARLENMAILVLRNPIVLEPALGDFADRNISIRSKDTERGANFRETVVCGEVLLRGGDNVQALWTARFGVARGAGGVGGNGRTLRADLGGPRSGGRGAVSYDQSDGQSAGAVASGRHPHVRVGRHADPPRARAFRHRRRGTVRQQPACDVLAVDGVSVGQCLRGGAADVLFGALFGEGRGRCRSHPAEGYGGFSRPCRAQ